MESNYDYSQHSYGKLACKYVHIAIKHVITCVTMNTRDVYKTCNSVYMLRNVAA